MVLTSTYPHSCNPSQTVQNGSVINHFSKCGKFSELMSTKWIALITGTCPSILYSPFAARWYRAEDHVPELKELMRDMMTRTKMVHHCLDLFGATQKVSSTWKKAGYSATAYDIQLSSGHDITSQVGFKNLLQLSAESIRCGLSIACFQSFSLFFSFFCFIIFRIFSTMFSFFEMCSRMCFSILLDCSQLVGHFCSCAAN